MVMRRREKKRRRRRLKLFLISSDFICGFVVHSFRLGHFDVYGYMISYNGTAMEQSALFIQHPGKAVRPCMLLRAHPSGP